MSWSVIVIYSAKHWLEIIGVITYVVCTWLTAKRKISCWPIGLISDFAYLAVFYQARLYADALLILIGLPLTFYSWWYWYRGYRKEGEVRVVRQPRSSLVIGLVIGAIVSLPLGVWMKHIHAALRYPDAGADPASV